MTSFSQIWDRIRKAVADRYVMTPVDRAFEARMRARNPMRGKGPRILVQNSEDKFFFLMLGEIVSALRQQGPLQADQYVARSLRPDGFGSVRAFVRTRLYWNIFTDRKWMQLYGAFCDGIAWRASAFHMPWKELSYAWKAWRAWRNLSSKADLFNLTIDGLQIGDLVIDTYLRFNTAPEVKVRDPAIFTILRQALRDLASAQAYFHHRRPALFVTSYTAYIQHGIAARMATRYGVPTLSFGNLQEFGTWITPDHICHTKRDYSYHSDFFKLPDQDERIARADAYLSARIRGAIDPATAYMKTSAYAIVTSDVPDVRGAAVVFLHDFFDSANVYRNSVFPDFWEWLEVTTGILRESGQPFFIKPHPNQTPESTREMERFVRTYPDVRVIPAKVTNVQLVQAGMVCGLTVYGTVVSELAFLGIPSICCSDNPFISFDFCRTARNHDQYREYLRGIPDFAPDKAMMRRQACIFDYMHNLNLDDDAMELRDAFVRAWMQTIDMHREEEKKPQRYFDCFDILTATPAFRSFATRLYAGISTENPEKAQLEVTSACSPIHRS